MESTTRSRSHRASLHAVAVVLLGSIGSLLSSCDRPAQSMRDQPRFEPYEATRLFDDRGVSRHLVLGTVGRYAAHDARVPPFSESMVDSALDPPPPEATLELLHSGHVQFNVWCSPCHGRDGYGRGTVVQRGYPEPPSFHTDRLRQVPDEHVYSVITRGLGKMPPYGPHVPPGDRWAVVAYLRVLQLSQHASLDDAPPEARERLLARLKDAPPARDPAVEETGR